MSLRKMIRYGQKPDQVLCEMMHKSTFLCLQNSGCAKLLLALIVKVQQ